MPSAVFLAREETLCLRISAAPQAQAPHQVQAMLVEPIRKSQKYMELLSSNYLQL